MFLFRKPRVWFALLVILSIWVLYDKSSETVTPRYFADETQSSMVSCRKYLVWMGFLRRVTLRTWLLEGLKFISHIFSHFSRLSRSLCELRARYIAVSSAKSLTLDLTCSGRSIIYTRKSIEPRTEPCGTPEETGIQFEFTLLMTTACFLLSKKALIHFRVSPVIP